MIYIRSGPASLRVIGESINTSPTANDNDEEKLATPIARVIAKDTQWTEVKRKLQQSNKEENPTEQRKALPKPPVVLVKFSEGSTYTDTVKALLGPNWVNLEEVGVSSKSVKCRRTRDGYLLVEVGKGKGTEVAVFKLEVAYSAKLGSNMGVVS